MRHCLSTILGSFAFALMLVVPTIGNAAGCSPVAGKILFDDMFKDSAGGWDDDPSAIFGKPALSLTLGKTEASWTYINQGFDAHDADYCLEAVVPNQVASGNDASVGLVFLYVDDKNYFKLDIYSDATIELLRFVDGEPSKLYDGVNDAVTAKPGSVVVLDVIVDQGLLRTSVNGVDVRRTRAQMPDKAAKFGVAALTDKVSGREVTFQFDRLRVAALP